MKVDVKEYERFYDRLGLKEHPLAVFYSDEEPTQGIRPKELGRECILALLKRARHHGETVYFDEKHTGCPGGAYYMGFRPTPMPNIEYFLSCGIPGEMEGERYIKTPEIAREYFASTKPRKAPAKYAIFKPLNKLAAAEEPEVIIFFASPDVLSGLVVLTGYASERGDAIRLPFSSGCGSILTHPLKEGEKEKPQAILGMFDVSARPFVEPDTLTLAMPPKLFHALLTNQDESFLITKSWEKVRERINKGEKP
ncbi:MAG: DUF169 domain-containing protein [Thermodesulfobacteriota bacterium]|nr:DUF169 domain-containing protein [Thermodesulfobacteriota bacterium]